MDVVHGRHSLGSDSKEALRTTAAFGRWIAATGLDVAFRFQAIEGGVYGSDGYFAIRAKLDLPAHGYSIGSIFEAEKSEHDDVLEFAEVIAAQHYIYSVEQISRG